jgi:hypothetical protein
MIIQSVSLVPLKGHTIIYLKTVLSTSWRPTPQGQAIEPLVDYRAESAPANLEVRLNTKLHVVGRS